MRTINKDKNYFNKIKIIQTEFLMWGEQNLRKFPWRETLNSYEIVVAEVMLHRTKANQVKDVYEYFITKYPDFDSIVRAGRESIRADLKSLGLFWRADLLFDMAKYIVEEYNCELPLDKKKLMAMPGIGNYISAAILCVGYNLPEPMLDTNTVRVLGRIFGLKITDSQEGANFSMELCMILLIFGIPKVFLLL